MEYDVGHLISIPIRNLEYHFEWSQGIRGKVLGLPIAGIGTELTKNHVRFQHHFQAAEA